MTPTEAQSLSARWVAAMGDRAWAAGMLADGRVTTPKLSTVHGSFRVYHVTGGIPHDLFRHAWGNRTLIPILDPVLRTDDAATRGAMVGVLREAWQEPTLHLRPATRCSLANDEDYVVWYVERQRLDGSDQEWLRESGAWGAQDDGHRDPPIECATEAEALVAAAEALAAQPKATP